MIVDCLMSRPNFQNLQVYKLSEKLADEIWNIVNNWDYFAKDTVGKQIVRSADSPKGLASRLLGLI